MADKERGGDGQAGGAGRPSGRGGTGKREGRAQPLLRLDAHADALRHKLHSAHPIARFGALSRLRRLSRGGRAPPALGTQPRQRRCPMQRGIHCGTVSRPARCPEAAAGGSRGRRCGIRQATCTRKMQRAWNTVQDSVRARACHRSSIRTDPQPVPRSRCRKSRLHPSRRICAAQPTGRQTSIASVACVAYARTS